MEGGKNIIRKVKRDIVCTMVTNRPYQVCGGKMTVVTDCGMCRMKKGVRECVECSICHACHQVIEGVKRQKDVGRIL